jgi:membrane protease YdiL (CAAX protease family)
MPGKGHTDMVLGAVVTFVVALAGWIVLFRVERPGMWPRTWFVAAALGATSILVLVAGRGLGSTIGGHPVRQVAVGVVVGVVWLVATHVGHDVLGRLFPAFLAQVGDLYSLQRGDRPSRVVGPIAAMGIAEELAFRGVIQGRVGLVAAVVAYTAVQLVTGNLALTGAGAACGIVWGTLAWWQGGLLAPVAAHLVWTSALTFVWPLPTVPVTRPGLSRTRAG